MLLLNIKCWNKKSVAGLYSPEVLLRRRLVTGSLVVLIYICVSCNHISTVHWSHQDQYLGQAGQLLWQKHYSFTVVLPFSYTVYLKGAWILHILNSCCHLIRAAFSHTVMWVIQIQRREPLMQSVNNHGSPSISTHIHFWIKLLNYMYKSWLDILLSLNTWLKPQN